MHIKYVEIIMLDQHVLYIPGILSLCAACPATAALIYCLKLKHYQVLANKSYGQVLLLLH